MSFEAIFRYLDSETDREKLLEDIRQVRREVINMTEIVPEDKWYEPRYHGWSLAAMLGHLQSMDNINMWLVQLALVGVRLPIPINVVDGFNDTMAQVFRRRLVETTVRGIETKEEVVTQFILSLPIDKFTMQVFHPPMGKYLTIEQALQVFFLHHWQEHLQTMRNIEDIQHEPPLDTSAG